jgi:hypothetical protein
VTTLVHAIPRFSHVRAHLGAYLFGVGATSALTAGAVVVFLSLATFVAFNGFPSLGGSSNDAGAAYLSSNASTPPTAAATALGAARGAVAKDPVPVAHLGSGSFDGSSGGGKSSGGGSSSHGGSTGPSGGGATNLGAGAVPPSGPAPSIPTAPAPPTDVPSAPSSPSVVPDAGGINPPPIDAPSAPSLPSTPSVPNVPDVPNLPSTSDPVTDVVQGVDNTAGTSLSGALD